MEAAAVPDVAADIQGRRSVRPARFLCGPGVYVSLVQFQFLAVFKHHLAFFRFENAPQVDTISYFLAIRVPRYSFPAFDALLRSQVHQRK